MPIKKQTRENMLLFLLITLLTFSACEIIGSDEKKPEPPLESGRRDYTWTVDTLSYLPESIFSLSLLWGNKPSNVWAVGGGDERATAIWHYNGKEWKTIDQKLSSNLASVYGFDSTDVWVTDSPGGNIYHFDGINWTKAGFYPYPGYSLIYFNNIWGPEPDEIYIAGSAYDQAKGGKAILMKYDGKTWKYVDLPEHTASLIWVRKSEKDNNLYFTAVDYTTLGDIYKIIRYDGKTLQEIYSGKVGVTAEEVNGEIYITKQGKIYKHKNGGLEEWKDFTNTTYIGRIWGRNEKDFFGVASDGLAHYNGTDMQTIYPTPLFINAAFVMENDVFVLCEGRIIIHGTLTKANE